VEVLITMFLLSIGVLGIQRAYEVGVKAGLDIENVEIAMNLAQAKMEELKDTAFESLADSGPTADAVFTDFYVTVNVAEGTNPMQVDVTVTWTSTGDQGSFALSTIIADY